MLGQHERSPVGSVGEERRSLPPKSMKLWKVVLLLNLALALGVGWGYLWWGRQAARLQRELVAARAQATAVEREGRGNGGGRAILADLRAGGLTPGEITG